MNTLLFISGQEILIILLFVLLLFGSKKIPDFARGLGKGLNEFRKATEDIKREINAESKKAKEEIDDINKEIKD